MDEMGADIHMFAEQKINGEWVAVKGPSYDLDEYKHRAAQEEVDGKTDTYWHRRLRELEQEGDVLDCMYGHRNYDVFAILANVRNGRGFAGIKTGDGFNPIAMPKGLPEDVSAEIKAESDDWGVDGHSHTWLTLKELLDYDWNQGTGKTGVVSEKDYAHFKECGTPENWVGDISGGAVVHLTNDQMDSLIANGYYIKDQTDYACYEVACVERGMTHDPRTNPGVAYREEQKKYFTRIVWGIRYIAHAKEFYDMVIPKMQALAGDDPESVRLVFWFDN